MEFACFIGIQKKMNSVEFKNISINSSIDIELTQFRYLSSNSTQCFNLLIGNASRIFERDITPIIKLQDDSSTILKFSRFSDDDAFQHSEARVVTVQKKCMKNSDGGMKIYLQNLPTKIIFVKAVFLLLKFCLVTLIEKKHINIFCY